MKRLALSVLFIVLLGLTVAPLNILASSIVTQFWNTVGTGKSSDNQTLKVAVDLISLRIYANESADQTKKLVGHFNPPKTNDQYRTFNGDQNYAEWVVEGAKGYEFIWNVSWTTRVVLPGSPGGRGITLIDYRLQGADDADFVTTGGDSFLDIPNEGSGWLKREPLDATTGLYHIRATIAKFKMDIGLPHGDYLFPVTVSVGYATGY
jgi:hypothetical protein